MKCVGKTKCFKNSSKMGPYFPKKTAKKPVNDIIITRKTSIFGIQFYFVKAMLLLNVSTKFE